MKTTFKGLALGAVVATMTLASVPGAVAAPTDFTFDPSATNPVLSTPGSAFTADNLIFSQFSKIDITGGRFDEVGILRVAQLQNDGFPLSAAEAPGFNGNAGATPYGLYFTFTATGTSGTTAGSTGVFDSLTVTFWGDVGNDNGRAVATASGVSFSGNTANDVELATGTLVSGTVGLSAPSSGTTPLIPTANVLALFTQSQPSAGGFFVDPATMMFTLDSNFSNTRTVVTQSSIPGGIRLLINGGGGNGTIEAVAVPEPASLALLGAGLLGLGFVRRARRKAA